MSWSIPLVPEELLSGHGGGGGGRVLENGELENDRQPYDTIRDAILTCARKPT